MKDMTLTQEYFTCAVNSKGKNIKPQHRKAGVPFGRRNLLELQMEGCISIDRNASQRRRCPPQSSIWRPLYAFLDKPRSVKMEKLLEVYTYSFTDRYFRELTASVESSLQPWAWRADGGAVCSALSAMCLQKRPFTA